MELGEILNKLYEGKKLTLRFDTAEARENFRTALYKRKRPQDKVLQDILDEQKKVLKFSVRSQHNGTESDYIAIIWLENKPSDTDFEVLSIE